MIKEDPVTVNNKELTERLVPALKEAVGEANVAAAKQEFGGESFSFFASAIPGLSESGPWRCSRSGTWRCDRRLRNRDGSMPSSLSKVPGRPRS